MSMLSGIKELIKRQNAYQEATELLLEDATGRGLDEIILGQSTTPRPYMEEGEGDEMSYGGPEEMELGTEAEDPEAEEGNEPADPEENDAPTPPEGGSGEGDDDKVPEGDIGDEEIGDDPAEKPAVPEPEEDPDDIGNQLIDDPAPAGGEQPMSVPGMDGLPEPVGRQTGLPAQDDNLVDVNLDLQSNTMRDVLPVPPAGAAQAVVGDTMDQRVDAGFGGDSGDVGSEEIGDTPITPATPEPGAEPPAPTPAGAAEESGDDVGEMDIGGDENSGMTESGKQEESKEKQKSIISKYSSDKEHEEKIDDFTVLFMIKPDDGNYQTAIDGYKKDITDNKLKEKIDGIIEKEIPEIFKSGSGFKYYIVDFSDDGPEEYYVIFTSNSKKYECEVKRPLDDGSLKSFLMVESASYTEAITLGGGGEAEAGGDDGTVTAAGAAGEEPAAEETPADAGVGEEPAPDEGASEGEGENPVTAAVRDKVAEEEGIDAEGTGSSNEELMKKLSSLTKSIEDAKQLVMKKIT